MESRPIKSEQQRDFIINQGGTAEGRRIGLPRSLCRECTGIGVFLFDRKFLSNKKVLRAVKLCCKCDSLQAKYSALQDALLSS